MNVIRQVSDGKPMTEQEELEHDYQLLLRYVTNLAHHKMGYPVSLLTFLGIVDNKVLGIMPNSLANILLNNVGDPFRDSETSLMEVKRHERELIYILENFYGMGKDQLRGYITTGGTEGNFAALWWSKRYLINSAISELIDYDNNIKLQKKDEQELILALNKIPFNDYKNRNTQFEKIIKIRDEINQNKEIVQQLTMPTVFFAKGPTHYSVPKISEILRLNVRGVEPNSDGSINLEQLKKELLLNLVANPHSALIVIANIGTTITGAIDNVPGIKKVLETYAPHLPHTIHMDGALTGFVLPVIKPFGEVKDYFTSIGVNTLAVSAHKYPGLSQPCGVVLAQRDFFNKAFEKSERNVEYVGNILDITITGSRSGLNVLMFYNALKNLNLDKNKNKLQEMVNLNMENAKYLYDKLVLLYGRDKVYYPHHFNVMFPKPSTNLAKKYQLMLTGDKATICVLANVTKSLIDQFIRDLIEEKENAMHRIDYKIQTLSEEHLKSTVDLFTKSFCDSEPITRHLGIQYEDYVPFTKEVVQKAIKDKLSKVAIDERHQVIACCIAEDITDPFIPKLNHYPKLKPVFAILEELSKKFFEGKKFIKGKVAHVWIAIVDQKYRGYGLSTAIDLAVAEVLARKGYDFVYAEFTNPISERIINQYSLFQMYNKIKYDQFAMGNYKPFAGLSGAAASYVIVIRPGIKLNALDHCYKVEEKY